MCNYVSVVSTQEEFEEEYDAEYVGEDYAVDFKINGFANPKLPVILDADTDHIVPAQWGFLPTWAKDQEFAKKTLNARMEEVHEKPSYKNSVSNRCLILVIPLYRGKAPGTENWTQKEAQQFNELFKTEVVFNVTQPSILVFEADKSKANGTVVVVAPGGGFQSLSINREGIDVAKKLAENGITAVVLKYRLLETKSNDPAAEMMENIKDRKAFDARTAPIKLMAGEDIKTAITYIRTHAKELNINPEKLGGNWFFGWCKCDLGKRASQQRCFNITQLCSIHLWRAKSGNFGYRTS